MPISDSSERVEVKGEQSESNLFYQTFPTLDTLAAPSSQTASQANSERDCSKAGLPPAKEIFAGEAISSADMEKPMQAENAQKKLERKQEPVDEKKIADLITKLDDEKFPVRKAAGKELESMGAKAIPQLIEALNAKLPLEPTKRIEQILRDISNDMSKQAGATLVSATEWIKSAENGHSDFVPDLLDGKITKQEGQMRAGLLNSAAKVQRALGNQERADSLETQAAEWQNADQIRKQVKSLNLGGDNLSDRDLAKLEGLPNLKELKIEQASHITDAGLSSFKNLSALEELSIVGPSGATGEGLEHSAFPSVKTVTLEGLGNETDKLAAGILRCCPNVADLTLNGGVTDSTLKVLDGSKDLKSLSLAGDNITDAGTKFIGKMSKLSDLTIEGITDSGLEGLKGASGLKHLKAVGGITDKGLAHLKDMKQLEQLTLRGGIRDGLQVGAGFTGDGLRHITGLTNLKSLCIASQGEIGSGLQQLSALKNLQRLNVLGSISDSQINELKNFHNLQKLYVDTRGLTETGFNNLSNVLDQHLPNLKAFNYWPPNQENEKIKDERAAIDKIRLRRKVSGFGF